MLRGELYKQKKIFKVFIFHVNCELTFFKKVVVGPFSADSANSVHGAFSRVQKANGMAEMKGLEELKSKLLKRLTPSLLKADHIDTGLASHFYHFGDSLVNCPTLLLNGICSWSDDRILNDTNTNNSRLSCLLGWTLKAISTKLKITLLSKIDRIIGELNGTGKKGL